MVDSEVMWETLKGKNTSDAQLSLFKTTVFTIVVLLLVNGLFTGITGGSVAGSIINLAYLVLLIIPIALYGTAFLRDKTDGLEGFGMWFVGGIPLYFGLIPSFNLSISQSFSFLPALSYLASLIGELAPAAVLKVNNIYAPFTETWIIFSLAVAWLYFLSEQIIPERSDLTQLVVGATPFSIIFFLLHAKDHLGFALFSSVFMFSSLALFFYEEQTPGDRIKIVSVTMGLLASIHATVNIMGSGGLQNFLSGLLAAGDFASLMAFFLYTGGYLLGALYWARWGWRRFG